MADGTITLATKVDTTGIENSENNIKNISQKLGKELLKTSNIIQKSMDIGNIKVAQYANSYKNATIEVEKQLKKVDELKKKLSGLESGDIKVKNSGTDKIQRDFDKTKTSIKETQTEVNNLYSQLDRLQNNAFKSPDTGEIMLTKTEQAEFDKIIAKLDELEPKLAENKQKAKDLGYALKEAMGADTQNEINKTKDKLSGAEQKLDNLSNKAKIAGQKMEKELSKPNKNVNAISAGFGKMNNKLFQLARGALVFSAITKGFTLLRNNIGTALMANYDFRNSIYQLQAALWVVSEPIYQAILPALQLMVKWITVGIMYIAAFFSALNGKTIKETMKSAKALNKQAESYKDVAKSSKTAAGANQKASKSMKELAKETKEANKQLADFDELMILQNQDIDETKGVSDYSPPVISGVQSGFEGLDEFLDSDVMQNLEDFQNWVLNNKDTIKTALEIAGLGLLSLGIGKVASKIGTLLGLFSKKDKALDTQTGKTNTETEAVTELANAFGFAPVPAFAFSNSLDGITSSAFGLIPQLGGVRSGAMGLIPQFNGVTSAGNVMIPVMENVSQALFGADEAFKTMDNTVKTTTPSIETTVQQGFGNAEENVNTFAETDKTLQEWGGNVTKNVDEATTITANNIYESLESSRKNIELFAEVTSLAFAQWGINVIENSGKSAKEFVNNWAEATKSVFSYLKDLAKATGEKLSGIWKEHGATIVTTAALAGLAITGIALAPYTGGASLMLPALAKGAVLPANKPFLAMVGDQKHGTNIETPLATMIEAFNIALDSRGGGGDGTLEVPLVIDGREFGRASVKWSEIEKVRTTGGKIGTKVVFG